jgi:inosine/xanthosine triphosphatase
MSITLCIGSLNPVKIKGVRAAFEEFFTVSKIIPKKVPTSVPPQPLGLDEILEGALERAKGCFEPGCDYAVGVEAGFYVVNDEPFDVEASYVIEKNGSYSYGFSPSFPVPRRFYEWILTGKYKELEEAVEYLTGVERIGEKQGFIGFLTKGRLERYMLSYAATIMALVKLLNKELYGLI